ncbi:MAG: Gfo/Idh/MocA family oxidoreductase [Planctomycetes bacterium]|nr:Gfo/Idh/MocA family oxidoreductase [Planctomycetota bacterium]
MNTRSISRRGFLKSASLAAAGGLAWPQIFPRSILSGAEGAAPSERISVGWIGTGHRGGAVMGGFLAQKDVKAVAVCDVKTDMREQAQKRISDHHGGAGCAAYNDFRELVARKDIDAVLVSSTDHWHVLHSIAAARAGMDVYMEKPMGLNMAECAALREAMEKNSRVFQFGTQQRSDARFRLACELSRNEKIGKLHTINVWSPGSSAGGSTQPASVPSGLDYDMWLGPAPFKPYTPDRCSNSLWWFISDYALGFIAGWGIHPIDIGVWGADGLFDGPIEVEGKGEFPKQGVCDTALDWRVKLKFASGVKMNFTGSPMPEEWKQRYPGIQSHGTAFEGSDGWVHVNRSVVNSHPESLVQSKIPADGVHLYESTDHVRNFLDCVKSRKPTVCSIEESVRSESLCQISELAIRLERKLTWDPKRERFTGDEEANRRLSRSMRAPWSL